MQRATGKAERLLQIESLLLSHPEGLTQAEIARRTGVNRSTIYRTMPDLTSRFSVYEMEDGRLAIDRDHYLMNVRLTLHEAMAVHLAARLMATRSDKRNPHAAAALRKLGLALEKLAPRIAEHLEASAEVMESQAQRHDPVYLDVLETLTRAWSDGQVARVWHRLEDGRVFSYDFAPYFIEPYAIGQTAHVIGWRRPPGQVRTFKIERIQRIELTDERYTIPDDFDPRRLLADAWGIWYTESEPVEVVLRFHPRVAHRVRETQWHRSEQAEEQPDGRLIWRAQVAETREMLPWIRGWGADVEVLEPEELRDEMVNASQQLATLYRVAQVKPRPLYQLLWAKTERKTNQAHPLICHMIDVAQVTLALWDNVLTDGIRAQFSDALGLDRDATGWVIAFWAGLHDLGKASPAFQRKHEPTKLDLCEAGLCFPQVFSRDRFSHGAASTRFLQGLLQRETGLQLHAARSVARAVGGHHGAWPTPSELQDLKPSQLGDEGWDVVRHELFSALAEYVGPPAIGQVSSSATERNALWTLLSGLTSVADWIGSMEERFPYAGTATDLERYAGRAAQRAREALDTLHWTGWAPPTEPVSFSELFDVAGPRPVQTQVIELAERLDRPSLVIIEAPTGVGKTEAALFLADHWARTQHQRGLYVAMPTMATSNQMFRRTEDVLALRYPRGEAFPLLVHSQARWMRDLPPPDLRIIDMEVEDRQSSVDAMAWFLPRKRSLLAPFAVGTVDQVLLSVLQTRHFFVRLFGLSHKTLVFDEVHAYDTYMSTLFQRLLRWLHAVGASVVILSATLPEKTRCELLRAYAGEPAREIPPAPYPAITWAMRGQVGVAAVEPHETRRVVLDWIDRAPNVIAERLGRELCEGGCAAVICNTVGRAQQVYRALRKARIVPKDDLVLFHARFPFQERRAIEDSVLRRFGKNAVAADRHGIVIATQVIEQSLDLDFDLMVSDLAPVDLIIQRAGRLHRHKRESRPSQLRIPHLLIAAPPLEDGVPEFDRKESYVYEPYVLLRSYLALQGHTQLILPDDTTRLIEAVYGEVTPTSDSSSAVREALAQAHARMQGHDTQDSYQARLRMVAPPEAENLLRRSNQGLAEDSPGVHQALQALTRLGPPSVSLVCLHQVDGELYTAADGSRCPVDLHQKPDEVLTQALVQATVRVSHWGMVEHFRNQEPPSGWSEHPLLRRYSVAVFQGGSCPLTNTPFTLHLSELGLEIIAEQ